MAANIARAKRRNQERLDAVDASDISTAGEYRTGEGRPGEEEISEKNRKRRRRCHLSSTPSDFFNAPARGPDDAVSPPGWFLRELAKIARSSPSVPTRSAIVFENTKGDASKNEEILRSVDFDVARLISANRTTTLGYGSEFRTVEQLRPLLGSHPNFDELSKVFNSGMSYVFDRELDALTKSKELRKLLQRGNHKSAQDSVDKVSELISKDVVHGFVIPIPPEVVEKIPGAAVQPLGLARQWSINEAGERVEKLRLTQDLSFSSNRDGSPTSVNSRIDMSAYKEMIFGWCLPRILHFIVAIRIAFPLLRIM